jgi:hypothetical protein
MDQLFYSHVRAFLLSHQIGEDPEKNLAKIKVIANSNPASWNGKLPTRGISPDTTFWNVAESSRSRPIVPWWWYARENEPVPEVVRDLYEGLSFDFVMVYQTDKAWIYVVVEPPPETMRLLARQDHLKAFLLMSLVNKNIPRTQREHKRLRLAGLMGSKNVQKIFAFVAFKEDEPAYRSIPAGVPVLSRLVHPSSRTANWSIRLPQRKDVYGSFREIVPA